MDGLRWLLLLIGLLVIAGVWWYSRRERDESRPSPGPTRSKRIEPSLDGSQPPADIDVQAEAYEAERDEFRSDDPPPDTLGEKEASGPPRQKIVTMRLVAKKHGAFAGDDLILNLRAVGMRHGKFGIFHRYDDGDERKVVFSAASLVEPGSFDLENIGSQKIPGISLFMVLPGPMDGARAFDLMMDAGRNLAKTLNAEVLDESGSTLSIQRERYLREEVIQHQHGITVD